MELESLIRGYVRLGHKSAKGFEPCVCAACNDHSARGGFKFEGDTLGYACFNCGLKLFFDPNGEYKSPSKKFRLLLHSFGIPDEEISKAVGKGFIEHRNAIAPDKAAKPIWSPPKSIEPPDKLHHILDDTSPWCSIARDYVQDTRGLDPACYPFMVSEMPKLLGRLIIPYFHRERLIYYQGRSMDDVTIQPRYANPVIDKDRLIFNYDELFNGAGPLYVTEGAFDALSIGPACALSDSNLGEWKLDELRKASRSKKIIFVIDKNENGFNLGLAALKEGWHVVVMPDGIDDANSCMKKFGKLWLLDHLASTQATGVAGEVLLRMKCKRRAQQQQRKYT